MRLRLHFLVTAGMQFVTVLMAAARTVLFSNLFGAGAETDAYYNAFLWFRVFLEDVPTLLLPALLPWYTQIYNSSDRVTAHQVFVRCVLVRGMSFVGFVALIAILSPAILAWTGSHLSDEARRLALQLMLAFLGISPGLFLATMYRMHLESQRRFAESAVFRTLLWGWSIVALGAAPWLGIWSAVVGPVFGVVTGVLLLRAFYQRDLRNKSEIVASAGPVPSVPGAVAPGLAPPGTVAQGSGAQGLTALKVSNSSLATMLVSIALQRGAGFLDLHFSSLIAPGSLTVYTTVGTLVSLPVILLVQSLTTVLAPEAAAWRASGRNDLMRAMLPRLIGFVLVASACAAGIVCLSSELLIHLLFSRGSLDATQLEAMTQALRFYSLTIVFLSLQNSLSGLTATLGGFYVLVLLPALALLGRYALLASYGDRLTLVSLVFGNNLYHGVWAFGLVLYVGLWVRSSGRQAVLSAGVAQFGSSSGAR